MSAIRKNLKKALSFSAAFLLLLQLTLIPGDVIEPTPPEDDGIIIEDDTIIPPPGDNTAAPTADDPPGGGDSRN